MKIFQDAEQAEDISAVSATPVKYSLQGDDDVAFAELKFALNVCWKKGAPRYNQILNQELMKLPHERLPVFLDGFNKISETRIISRSWKSPVTLTQQLQSR